MAGEAPGAISAAREKKKEEKSLKNNDVLDFLRNLQNRVGMCLGLPTIISSVFGCQGRYQSQF